MNRFASGETRLATRPTQPTLESVLRIAFGGMLIPLLGVTLVLACSRQPRAASSSTPVAAAPDCERWRSATLTLVRDGCYGSCPVYRVDVHGNGEVTYQGQRYVRERGPRTIHVDPAVVCRVFERAADSFRAYSKLVRPVPHPCNDEPIGGLFLNLTDKGADFVLGFSEVESCRPTGFPSDAIGVAASIDELAGTAEWVPCRDATGHRASCDN